MQEKREKHIKHQKNLDVTKPLMFKGTMNGEFFAGWVEHVLAPTLSQGEIVFLDNCSSHKVAGVLDPIYARGATGLSMTS